jgi:glycine/D-amino acid oxidase-like deaminating enzyme
MYSDPQLAGVLTPRYSYLVALPHRDPGAAGGMAAPDSANFFTFGFSHDWCVADNFVRISGEDHYSGLKSPRADERCGRLARWGWQTYPYLQAEVEHPQKYAIYSETADFMPLVGTPHDDSRVCYMVGCNAWGQASLSAAAALAPALLGYRALSPEDNATARLFSIRRFSARSTAAA